LRVSGIIDFLSLSCLRFDDTRLKFFLFLLYFHVLFKINKPNIVLPKMAGTPILCTEGGSSEMSPQDFKFSRADFVSPPIDVVPNYDSDDDSPPSSESSDESDPEETNGESREEHSARERERQRVLKAAGLVVTADAAPPPKRKRRPAPAAPKRSSVASSITSKDLPPVPEANSADAGLGVEDAFDRYEAFKQSHGNVNRMSVASVDTGSSSPVSPPHGGSMSKEGESRGYTSFLQFLRASGDSEKRSVPTISAPISISPTPSSRAQSPGFGTVSVYFRSDI
jgi:hypothetical protein